MVVKKEAIWQLDFKWKKTNKFATIKKTQSALCQLICGEQQFKT